MPSPFAFRPSDFFRISVFGFRLFLCLASSAQAQLSVITANQQGSLPFTPAWIPPADSLIAGLAPSTNAGNFSLNTSGRTVNSLTAGGSLTISQIPGNDTSINYITAGNAYGAGSLLVYSLPGSTNGYDLTNITVYGGWKDNGRDQQAYTVSYSTISAPTNFTSLAIVNYNPSVPANTASATRCTLADAAGGLIASRVAALKFDFTSPSSENGYCGYAAISVTGTKSSPPSGLPIAALPTAFPANANTGVNPGTSVILSAAASGQTPITYQWQTDGGSGGALTNIPGATNPTFTANTTGFTPGTYRYDYVATNALGASTSPALAIAIVSMVDIGAGTPIPGPQDIAQLSSAPQTDDGINYYTDNGASYGHWSGQTFTAGTNQNGYVLQSLAWKSAGNGNGFGNSQLYHLYLYALSPDGSAATVIATYQGNGGGIEGHWLQWRGLSVPLAPNQLYAYAFGRDASAGGWEHIANRGGNPYAAGQIMSVANTTGTGLVTYGNADGSDAAFDLGLTLYQGSAPLAQTPAFTPNTPFLYAGTPVSITLNESPLGVPPFSFQWLTDNGSGGPLIPINGATGSNLVLNAAALAVGNYHYAVLVSNTNGASVSSALTLNLLGATAPAILTDTAPSPANVVNVGQTATFSASFAGTPPISYQWTVDTSAGPSPIPDATNSTLVLANVQLTNAGVYSLIAQNLAGSTPSSGSTLIVTPPPGTPPAPVTLPPVSLQITPSGNGAPNLTWAQGTLLQATNILGPWTSLAASLETTNSPVPAAAPASFYKTAVASQPRIVNIYNFVRDNDYRLANSQQVLFNATTQQVQLVKQANLPATFALQHDALMDTNYQFYFKQQLPANCELAAWWEITQSLVERAGLTWRGQHEWESTANIAFSCGYSPADRIKLVDAYFADFKAVYGYYPRTVGSWYIDEVTLAYMANKYGIVASCNCKDQIGTDTYTLWGGYWNQAYYPSTLNAYMPAQTAGGQINVPVFRMLGSDPIYQYGNFSSGLVTLEPVYPAAGGSANWVSWFMNSLIAQPSLAFAYTQAGQENSFGWDAMSTGLTRQVALLAAQAGQIQAQTLAQSGQWFRAHYSHTPPTSVVALSDWQNQGRKTVWYNSRFYRLNILWQNNAFFIRDLHCFDENVPASTHNIALATTYFDYETLPLMDGDQWSGSGNNSAGIWPVLLNNNGTSSPLTPSGPPVVREQSPTDLLVQQPLSGGATFTVSCSETNLTFTGTDALGKPLNWAWDSVGGAPQTAVIQNVSSNTVSYSYAGNSYQLRVAPSSGSCRLGSNGDLWLLPNSVGKLVLLLNIVP